MIIDIDDLPMVDEESSRRCEAAHKALMTLLDGMNLDYGDTMTVLSKMLCEMATDDLDMFIAKMGVAYVFYKAPDTTERSH